MQAVVCYQHEAPGDLQHIDNKKLGRIVHPSRVMGNRENAVSVSRWEISRLSSSRSELLPLHI